MFLFRGVILGESLLLGVHVHLQQRVRCLENALVTLAILSVLSIALVNAANRVSLIKWKVGSKFKILSTFHGKHT